jgi:hypothetical protein
VTATSSSRFVEPNYWRDPVSGNGFQIQVQIPQNRVKSMDDLRQLRLGSEALDAPPARRDTADDAFLFAQGPTRGLGKITFPDWRPIFDAFAATPNVARFREQADALVAMLEEAPLTPEQMTADLDFQQSLAQLFTLIPYAQLILEQAQLDGTPQDASST